MIKIKRVYEPPSKDDGMRILVDRLWPRGLKKEKARVDAWMRDVAPSTGLRKWFDHDPEKWGGFKKRFFSELAGSKGQVDEIIRAAHNGTVTLLFGAKEERYNNAAALKEYIEARLGSAERKKAA